MKAAEAYKYNNKCSSIPTKGQSEFGLIFIDNGYCSE